MVEVLADGYHIANEYSLVWDASSQPSGVYFITMVSGEFTSTQKVILLK